MVPHDSRSPCAADTLFAVTPLMVNGKTVGILRLCDTVADVRALGLLEDRKICKALIERADQSNFIPDSLRDAYADALLAYCHATQRPGGSMK